MDRAATHRGTILLWLLTFIVAQLRAEQIGHLAMQPDHDNALRRALLQVQLPPSITVRAWREEDFSAIQKLSDLENWPTPRMRPGEALEGWHNAWPALVAVADNAVVGFLRALSDGNITTYICELLVDARWRGRGVGCALLDACHALYPRARMEVTSTEDSASFYRRYGFCDIGQSHRKSFV